MTDFCKFPYGHHIPEHVGGVGDGYEPGFFRDNRFKGRRVQGAVLRRGQQPEIDPLPVAEAHPWQEVAVVFEKGGDHPVAFLPRESRGHRVDRLGRVPGEDKFPVPGMNKVPDLIVGIPVLPGSLLGETVDTPAGICPVPTLVLKHLLEDRFR